MVVGLLVAVAALTAANLLVTLLRRPPAPPDLAPILQATERTDRTVRDELARSRDQGAGASDATRAELAAAAHTTRAELLAALAALRGEVDTRLDGVRGTLETRLDEIRTATASRLDQLRADSTAALERLRDENARQLETMRQTVDEKLQGTLEKRLGDSFRLVSERLELVHRGLGEMQSLASGVGDLKRVLTNVKARGTWGEVQLGALLEQMLTPEQFARNVATTGGGERVEYAIRLPGPAGDPAEPVWLPVDAKFPREDYERLVDAQERADAEAAEQAARALEQRLRACAAEVARKYLSPPRTTDFAILFLPTEGLYAEALRRPGLADGLQRDHRVVLAGPTTLAALLSSLQMGFRTLAIQQRSSEVWTLLGAVKTEFQKYGEVLDRVQRKLAEASRTIDDEVGRRTRAIQRKLREVEAVPGPETARVLLLDAAMAAGAADAPEEPDDLQGPSEPEEPDDAAGAA